MEQLYNGDQWRRRWAWLAIYVLSMMNRFWDVINLRTAFAGVPPQTLSPALRVLFCSHIILKSCFFNITMIMAFLLTFFSD